MPIKGQALVGFIIEWTENPTNESENQVEVLAVAVPTLDIWKVYEVGIVIFTPLEG